MIRLAPFNFMKQFFPPLPARGLVASAIAPASLTSPADATENPAVDSFRATRFDLAEKGHCQEALPLLKKAAIRSYQIKTSNAGRVGDRPLRDDSRESDAAVSASNVEPRIPARS